MRKIKVLYLLLMVVLLSGIIAVGCSKTTTSTATTPPLSTSSTSSTTSSTQSPPPTSTSSTTTSTTTTTPGVQTGGILTIISPNAPSSFGVPTKFAGFAPYLAAVPCLERLIDSDINGNLRGQLATSWDTAADLSSITFHLRQGVKFHDGTDFNAQVAKWNLDMYLEKGTGAQAGWSSVDIVDDYTVRINLKPDGYSNTQLTTEYYFISQAAFEKNGLDWAITHPVGTGPFKFKSFVRDTSLEFERFDDYWGDKARVDGIKFLYIVNATTAGIAFKAGDAQVWEGADAKTGYDLVTNLGFKRETRRGPLMNLVPDSAHPDSPFSKLEVRQAITYAIDRPEIAKTFGYGTWEAVNQPDAPEQFGHVADLTDYPFNPDKARQLLADAGYSSGFSTTIITSSAFSQDPLVAIQSYLADVGITAKIEVQAPPAWAATRTSGWTNGLFYVTHGATDYNYCAYLERYFLPTSLFAVPVLAYPTGWVDKVHQMMLSPDPAVYEPMARDLVKIYVDNVMEVPLWIQSEVYILDPWINDMGVGTHGNGFNWDANKVWIGPH
jgi:ABC-type transport system substrate-binding protein